MQQHEHPIGHKFKNKEKKSNWHTSRSKVIVFRSSIRFSSGPVHWRIFAVKFAGRAYLEARAI